MTTMRHVTNVRSSVQQCKWLHVCPIRDSISIANNEGIDGKCFSFLTIKKERTSLFYMLPKIHKRITNPPGRPIVSGNGCPTERISQLVDFFLQPTVQELPSYLRDTTHFLSRLRHLGTLPKDCLLITMDVASLYTNIPNDLGLEAARETLTRLRLTQDKPSTDNIILHSTKFSL